MTLKKYIILIVLPFFILGSCKKKEEKKEEVLRPVKYEIIETSDAQNSRTFSGVAEAGDEIELSFRSSGIITEFNGKVGQKVKKGALIAKLDNVQAKLTYEQSISALSSAKSAMLTSKSNLNRIKSLFEKGSNSLNDYEIAKNSYQSSLDQYESAKRNKSIQQTQINYGHIRAPKDGVLALINNRLNENVGVGQVIAVLNAGDRINVTVGLPESVINKTQLAMQTKLTFSAIEGQSFIGTIFEIAPVVDANSATYPVTINIENPSKDIKPGMATNITFDFSDTKTKSDPSLVVPVVAVGEDGNGNYVFLIESSDGLTGTVKKQTITIGELTAAGFKIISGLSAGDKVAVAGLQTLLDGQKVRLQ